MPTSRPSRRAALIANQQLTAHRHDHKRKCTEATTKRKRLKTQPSASCAGIPQPALSMEVWELVLQDCCPSQLAVVAQVSRYMYAVVRALPVWKTICQRAKLGEPTTRGLRKTYYGVTLPCSHRICEICFIKTRPSGSQAALPVFLDQHKKHVRQCLSCRQQHYQSHPEPCQPWEDWRLLERHGGRVGIEAEERRLQGLQETRAKNLQLRQDARRNELKQRLDGLQVDYCPLWTAFDRYVLTGKPDLDTTVADIIQAAQEKQEQDARRAVLEKRLAELGLEDYNLFECTAHIRTGSPSLETTVEAVVDVVRADEERKANIAKRRKELFERIDADSSTLNKTVTDRVERFVKCQWMDMDSLVRHTRDVIETQKKKETRRDALVRALRAHGLELRQDSTLCASYIETGAHDLEDVVRRMVELGWLFQETNYGSIRNGNGSRNHFKEVAIKHYISQRLKCMQWARVEDDPDTSSRPPKSLWARIQGSAPLVYKEHAKESILEGVARNATLKEIFQNAEPELFRSVTVEILLQAMDEGAVAMAKSSSPPPPPAEQSSEPLPLQPSRTFSAALKDLLGEEQFDEFISFIRCNMVCLAKSRQSVTETAKETNGVIPKDQAKKGLIKTTDEDTIMLNNV